jgi:hypothetical protein
MCKAPHVREISHVRCLISSSHKIKDVKILPDLSLHKDLQAGQSWDFRSCATLCQTLIFGTTPFSGPFSAPFSAPYSVLILHKTENFHFTNKISRSRSDNCPFPKPARVFLGFWFCATSEQKKEGGCGKQRGRVPEEQGFARERQRDLRKINWSCVADLRKKFEFVVGAEESERWRISMEGEPVQTTAADTEWGRQTDVSSAGSLQWPTIDGPLGVYNEEAVKVAKSFYYGGFLLLPLLWFVNCFYFWPVLQHREAEPLIRRCMMMLYAPFLVSHL